MTKEVKNFENIYELAAKKLEGKVDKAGQPILAHCIRVRMTFDESIYAAVALLHEVIEDGGATVDELNLKFGVKISESVDAISRRENESYMEYIKRCALNPIAREVKIADLRDNMDITRLDKLTKEDVERQQKYHKAYRYLISI